jgi:DNA replication and repair protein RecF
LITAAVAEDVPNGLDGDRFAVNGGRVERLAQEATSGGRL